MNKNKNPRNTDFSLTQRLLKKYGKKKLYALWCEHNGMYGASKYLTQDFGELVTAPTVRYLSDKLKWVRVVSDPNLPFVKGVLNGKVAAEYYKHIKFKVPGQSPRIG
jgi:hypothetical protein